MSEVRMWCEAQVQSFNDSIKLDPARLERIRAAIARFEEFCARDAELTAALASPVFLQGSVATQTVIKPLADEEFDVDAVYPFTLASFNQGATPAGIVQWFLGRLRGSEFYRNRLIPRDRCARIEYAGDFHVDIIPATQSVPGHQPYAIPAKDLGSWVTNDPYGFSNWVAHKDTRAAGVDADGVGRFVRSCRMMKRWRDSTFGADSAPSSVLLVTMLGKHDPTITTYDQPLADPLYPQYQADMAYLYDMLRLTHSCLMTARGTAFLHPTIQGEDLSRGWDRRYLALFLERLQTCIDHIRRGIYSNDVNASIGHYRDAFGATFPAA